MFVKSSSSSLGSNFCVGGRGGRIGERGRSGKGKGGPLCVSAWRLISEADLIIHLASGDLIKVTPLLVLA